MSYRTNIENVQIFGNNEYYPEWIEFIKSQGIEVDDEGNYSGEIHDFMGMLTTIETIVLNIEKERQNEIKSLEQQEIKAKNAGKNTKVFTEALHNPASRYYKRSIFDLRNIYENTIKDMNDVNETYLNSLSDRIFDIIDEGYMFIPYQAYNACKYKLEPCEHFSTPNHFYCYKIKDGETIHVSAG